MPLTRKRMAPAVPARGADLRLVENADEVRELEQLRDRTVAAQAWTEDKSFLQGFRRGDEVAWPSVEAFTVAQAGYLRGIQRRRAGKVGRVGERQAARYGWYAALGALKWPALGVLLLLLFYVALRSNFWMPVNPDNMVFMTADRKAALVAKQGQGVQAREQLVRPAPVLKDLGVPAGDVAGRRGEVLRSRLPRPTGRQRLGQRLLWLSLALFLFWVLRLVFRRTTAVGGRQEIRVMLDTLPE